MTREDLEKAIKNGKSLWYIFMKEIFKIEIKKHINQFISRDNEYCYTDEKKVERCFPIEVLFKTRVEAEHYLLHANVERVEKLPFLTWEEFKRKRELKFNSADGNYCELFIVNDFIYLQLGKEISMKQQNVGEATEENFYRAYDECVRLFRGGE